MSAIIMYENGKAIGGEGHPTNADDITFDNTGSDLVSEEVESAIKEVNGKSAKSADLTSISESGTTASQAISVGTYFYLDGVLCRAKTDIANGATFTLNTNYENASGFNEFAKLKLFDDNAEEEIGTVGTNKVYRRWISQSASLPYQAWGTVLTYAQLTSYGIHPTKILDSALGVYYNNAFYQSSSFLGVMYDTTNGLRMTQNMVTGTISALARGFITYYK